MNRNVVLFWMALVVGVGAISGLCETADGSTLRNAQHQPPRSPPANDLKARAAGCVVALAAAACALLRKRAMRSSTFPIPTSTTLETEGDALSLEPARGARCASDQADVVGIPILPPCTSSSPISPLQEVPNFCAVGSQYTTAPA